MNPVPLTPLELIIIGYTIIVFIIVGSLTMWVFQDMITELYRDWDKKRRAKEKEEYENKRRKVM